MTEIAYGWHPIEDLSAKERNFSDSGLNGLVAVWNEQREELTEKNSNSPKNCPHTLSRKEC